MSIREVADRFGLPISTLHYWERRNLIRPHRRSGRRYYSRNQVYRIALIQLWRDTGQLSLDEIATVLAGRTATHDWRDTVAARVEAIGAQITRLTTARTYLSHLLECPQDNALEQCPQFRATVAEKADVDGRRAPSGRA
ncbi:MerR family transcriptional regulator [Goodfellowiella coeruleoviolacea]|uniref:MerR family transcriptional regulator, redox-sensitive transcriptional activator SoxR n=1 Tax=Goodfellowiella coeruleoviolacea TaxID=334858 RepID=A0AAE3G7Y8_9PSEU|nr:MerR family transcriptional regulator [Goodfellowiella coeruleoviolacea]MCP2163307.1 MerR family transcriptional regulator, redox-sensitive transcriptional activator SoxR [Goodfellowiella coeruleoviolacea]